MRVKCSRCKENDDVRDDTVTATCKSCGNIFSLCTALIPSPPDVSEVHSQPRSFRPRRRPFAWARRRWRHLGTIVVSIALVTGGWLGARAIFGGEQPPLGYLDEMIVYFRARKMHTRVSFNPEKAETQILRGREYFTVPVSRDISRGRGVTIYFDENRIVRAITVSVNPKDRRLVSDRGFEYSKVFELQTFCKLITEKTGVDVMQYGWANDSQRNMVQGGTSVLLVESRAVGSLLIERLSLWSVAESGEKGDVTEITFIFREVLP